VYNIDEILEQLIQQLSVTVVVAEAKDFTGSVNNRLTRRHKLWIKGDNIMVAGEHATIGVYFRSEGGHGFAKIEIDELVGNEQNQVVVIVPKDLPKGSYSLEIITHFDGTGVLLDTPQRKQIKGGLRPTGFVPPR